jgi:SAM-dependent methyltransferase
MKPTITLALISGLVLYLELTLIRWLPAHVLYLTFFTNTVLLASFMGMCLGCLMAKHPTRQIRYTPHWIAVTVLLGILLNTYNNQLVEHIDVAGQKNPDVIFFGTEVSAYLEVSFKLPIEIFMATFFVLSAMCLVGVGQEMGRAFGEVRSRTGAYSANLIGSLLGIVLFGLGSYFQLSPTIWFGIATIGIFFLLRSAMAGQSLSAYVFPTCLLVLAVAGTLRTSGLIRFSANDPQITWSPYYRLDLSSNGGDISTNQIEHQVMLSRDLTTAAEYSLAYQFQRDVQGADGKPAWPAFRRILIIGTGSGNDLSRACQWAPPDAKIDAVEIDPGIQQIGAKHHPDKPYSDPRVTVHLNDGRNFLRRAQQGEYDLVVFAVIDSLVLHSGYSSLRLESFLFSEDSFKDVRRVLKPTGVCAVYNLFRQGWLVVRLREQLRSAFQGDPVVLTDPPSESVTMDQFTAHMTVFFAGSPQVVDALRRSFTASGNSYWIVGDRPKSPSVPSYFQKDQPSPLPNPVEADRPSWLRLKMANVADAPADLRLATDNWPFLYTRKPGIPGITWRGVGLMLILSAGLWFFLIGRHRQEVESFTPERGLMIRSFLLGAGFMLVETKAVVQMALLFGSTWMVNSFVFTAVLLMSLLGNLYAGWVKPKNLTPYYIGLLASLLLNVLVPLDAFLGLDSTPQILLSCSLAFCPIAFAGIIFAAGFARANNPDRVFAANVAGALVGGVSENLSMVFGFQNLLLVAMVYYGVSMFFGPNEEKATPEAKA